MPPTKPKRKAKRVSPRQAAGKINMAAIQSQIVERIMAGLRVPGGTVAAYRQSEGKNYGEYVKDGKFATPLEEVERLARRIAFEEVTRLKKDLGLKR